MTRLELKKKKLIKVYNNLYGKVYNNLYGKFKFNSTEATRALELEEAAIESINMHQYKLGDARLDRNAPNVIVPNEWELRQKSPELIGQVVSREDMNIIAKQFNLGYRSYRNRFNPKPTYDAVTYVVPKFKEDLKKLL